MELLLFINVKMSTIVDILTFIFRINTTYECLKQGKSLFVTPLPFMNNWNFKFSLGDYEISFLTLVGGGGG